MVFQPHSSENHQDNYFVYVQRFDCNHATSNTKANTGLFNLTRARNNESRLGAIVQAARIRCAVDVAPYFGEKADRRLTCYNSLEISNEFNLNKYSDKETFQLFRG
jgi:hypothetical protein